MSDVNIGTITTDMQIDLGQFERDIERVGSLIQGLADNVGRAMEQILNLFSTTLGQVSTQTDQVQGRIRQVQQTLQQTQQTLRQNIRVDNAHDLFHQFGVYTASGLADGLRDGDQDVKDAATGLSTSAVRGIWDVWREGRLQLLSEQMKSDARRLSQSASIAAKSISKDISDVYTFTHSPLQVKERAIQERYELDIENKVPPALARQRRDLALTQAIRESSDKAEREAERARKKLEAAGERVRDAIQRAQEAIFAATHTELEQKRYEARRQYSDDLDAGVPSSIAARRRDLALLDAENEARKRRDRDALTDEVGLQSAKYEAQKSDQEAIAVLEQADHARRLAEWSDEMALIRAKYDAQRADEKAISAQEQADRDEERREQAYFDVRRSDLEAIKAMEQAIYERRVEQNQADHEANTWELEVAQSDRQSPGYKANWSNAALMREKMEPVNKALHHALEQMRDGIEGILGGAFEQVFMGDTKNLFKNLLQSFEQLLAQMAAKALAAGIVNAIFGGSGGFLGGIVSAFGFDDATNDTKAARWGYDFQHFFDTGRADYLNAHGYTPATPRSGDQGGSHVYVTIGEVHNHTEADMNRFADDLAFRVQTGLTGRFTS